MKMRTITGFCLAAGIFLAAFAVSGPANAASLREGSVSAASFGALPGEVLWGYYETTYEGILCSSSGAATFPGGCNHQGNGDNILRLINPNGFANTNLAGAISQPVCAMVYVFDDNQEMGECCGCPITSNGLLNFSFNHNLTSNWAVSGPDGGFQGIGSVAVVAASVNTGILGFGNGKGCTSTQSGACNGGCDPTNTPGYIVSNINNLLGSITHNQQTNTADGLTELSLFDDAGGDSNNLTYLQNQCGALVRNGTGGGICSCPTEL